MSAGVERAEARERLREATAPLVGAAVAGTVALAGALGRTAVLAAVLAVQLVLALAWLAITELAGARVALTIVAGAAVVADALARGRDGAGIGDAVGVVAIAFAVGLLWQLARRHRSRVTESLADLAGGVVVVVLAAHLLSVHATRGGDAALATAVLSLAAAIVAGRVVDALLPTPPVAPGSHRRMLGVVAGVAVAAGTGAVLGGAWSPLSAASGALLAASVALAGLAADVGVDLVRHDVLDARRRAACRPLAALLPLAVAAPVAYAAVRLLVG